jgi:hypothetical protein
MGSSEALKRRTGELLEPTFPYDPDTMTWQMPRPSTRGNIRYITRRVARSFDEAIKQRKDYFHPGGDLYNADGNVVGSHPRGWFLGGYKWREDRPEVLATIDGIPTLEEELGLDEPDATGNEE